MHQLHEFHRNGACARGHIYSRIVVAAAVRGFLRLATADKHLEDLEFATVKEASAASKAADDSNDLAVELLFFMCTRIVLVPAIWQYFLLSSPPELSKGLPAHWAKHARGT